MKCFTSILIYKNNLIKFQKSSSSQEQLKRTFFEQQDKQRQQNYHTYLYLWIELLISTIKNWHKYKNIVKLVDFLISYTFNTDSHNQQQAQFDANDSNSQYQFINAELLDEFMSYVRIDFGIQAAEMLFMGM